MELDSAGLIGLGWVVRQRGTRASRETFVSSTDDIDFFSQAPEDFGRPRRCGEKLLVDHLVTDSLQGVDDESACELQRCSNFNHFGLELPNSLPLGEHAHSSRAGLDNRTIAEGEGAATALPGGLV